MSTGLVKNVNGIYVGTSSQLSQFRGRNNEIAINTTTKQFRLMDGKTLGGNALGLTATVEHLYDISDVLLDTLTPGQALVWDGNYWVNSTISTTIADGSVTEAKLAANAVTVGKIADGAVTNAKLAGSIALSKLDTTGGSNGQVLRLNGGVVTYSDYTLSSLGGVSISSPSLAQVLIYDNGTSSWKNKSVSGAISITKDGVTSIGTSVVTNDNLVGSIALSKLDTTGASSGNVIKFNGTSWGVGSDANTTSLSGLTTDVLISGTPTNGYVLTYNTTSSKWEPAAPSGGGATALSDLTDIDIPDPVAGDILVFDGLATWNNRKLGYSGQYASLGYDTGFALSVGKYYVSEIDADNYEEATAPTLYLPSDPATVSVGDTVWVYIRNDLTSMSILGGEVTNFDGRYILSTYLLEGGYTSNFVFEGVTYLDPANTIEHKTLRLEAGVQYIATVISVSGLEVWYSLTASNSLKVLGWSSILEGENPEVGDFSFAPADRGFVLQGASKESKAAFYYDDSTNKVYLKGNTASEGVDYYLEAGNSTGSNGGKIRLYGGYSTTGDGGYIRLRGGESVGTADGGYVELEGGDSQQGSGGSLFFSAGGGVVSNSGSGSGGSITLTSGYSLQGSGGDININTLWGIGYPYRAGNITLNPAGSNQGASEGAILLYGKTQLVNGGLYSNLAIYNPDPALSVGTTVYVYLNYSSTSVANGETFAIYKTADSGSTRYYVPLDIISPVIQRRPNISTYSYWGLADQSHTANTAVASFVLDTEDGFYTYVVKVTSNNDIADTTELKIAFSLSGGNPSPAYTDVLPDNLGGFVQKEYEVTYNELPMTTISQYGESQSYNQEYSRKIAEIDVNTKNVYFDSLKAGDSSIVVSTDGVLGLQANFSLDIPETPTNGEVLTYNESSSKWEAQGGIVPKEDGAPFTASGNYRYYLSNNPTVILPPDGAVGDVFYVQLSPTQTSLEVVVPSAVQRLVALYNQFVYTHPTNMYSGFSEEHPDYWTPSSLYNGDTVEIADNYAGNNLLVIPNFGGLVEFRCFYLTNLSLPAPHQEPVWHISVLSGLKSAIYTPALGDTLDTDNTTIIGKWTYVYRSEFVSPKVYYFIGDDTYPVSIQLPKICPAMTGIEINIKQTGLMDMTISPYLGETIDGETIGGETIDGEDSFIMSEKGSMATLMCDGTNWFLA